MDKLLLAVEAAAELCVMANTNDSQELERLAVCCDGVVQAAAEAGVGDAERRAIEARDLLRGEGASSNIEEVVAAVSRTVSEVQQLVAEIQAGGGGELGREEVPEGETSRTGGSATGAAGEAEGAAPATKDADPSSFPTELKAETHWDDETVHELVTESMENIESIEESLLILDERACDEEALNAAFRGFHTIKGGAGFLGLRAVSELAHVAEAILDRARERQITLKAEPLEAVFAATDLLKTLVRMTSEVGTGGSRPVPEEYPKVARRLAALAAGEPIPVAEDEGASPPTSVPTPSVSVEASSESSGTETSSTAESDPLADLPTELKGDTDSDAEMVGELVAESVEHLEAIESALLTLEKDPTDAETLNAAFRGFHTIKGGSGFLGLKAISELTHVAETLLDGARTGRVTLTGEPLDAVLAGADLLKTLIGMVPEVIATGGRPLPGEYPDVVKRLFAAAHGQAAPVAATPSSNTETETVPEAPAAETRTVEAPAASEGTPAAQKAAGAATAETATAAAKASGGSQETREASLLAVDQVKKAVSVGSTVKVSTSKLDGLVNMVGELVIAQSMVAEDPSLKALTDHRLTKNLSHMTRITRNLQELAMSMRMVPLRSTFQKMARLARDVAHKSGKKMTFSVTGEETELDRNLVEEISAPLIHLVRNAVDHGVEPQEERIKQGKSGVGAVELRAYHGSGNVVIEIRDNGKGLDRERILGKARTRGLVEDGSELTDRQVYSLCFQPGFSTAEKVTEVSGRGVGLDVVKRQIQTLRGRVDVDSAVGIGSTFSMKVPLTLAIIDGMVVAAGRERYIIPTTSIESCLKTTPDMLFSVEQKGTVIMVRGSVVPLFMLNRLFGIHGSANDASEGVVIIVEHEGRRCALVVDDLLGQQQVVIKGLGDAFQGLPGIAAASILGDGRVGLILDIPDVIKLATQTSAVPVRGSSSKVEEVSPSAADHGPGNQSSQTAAEC